MKEWSWRNREIRMKPVWGVSGRSPAEEHGARNSLKRCTELELRGW